ncbi:hypothetical protein BABINDRAFT_159363 [Babjeviella inositovora NRRL Y-12698]|uniref:Zn(2)-C6 fungal-type domain-containing protein n=1 Tax=Babjeviella inositovora NRRL Y-12698 TaxID=984486 RepID=A0A1E3QZ03_9ASCO|nr:uncharacterized protein BABINDRAFT_159363 [Babjeviella inositovora NRRL Y-12698]ODQ82866.1 hypothetical protein BABINDRAFT_159363 [Babjeviella inositovora NRRL Y-12698]
MTNTTPPTSPIPKPKKRKYSRGGCKECKRRKMKCDETKPSCWQCSRLGKRCVYESHPGELPEKSLYADAQAYPSQPPYPDYHSHTHINQGYLPVAPPSMGAFPAEPIYYARNHPAKTPSETPISPLPGLSGSIPTLDKILNFGRTQAVSIYPNGHTSGPPNGYPPPIYLPSINPRPDGLPRPNFSRFTFQSPGLFAQPSPASSASEFLDFGLDDGALSSLFSNDEEMLFNANLLAHNLNDLVTMRLDEVQGGQDGKVVAEASLGTVPVVAGDHGESTRGAPEGIPQGAPLATPGMGKSPLGGTPPGMLEGTPPGVPNSDLLGTTSLGTPETLQWYCPGLAQNIPPSFLSLTGRHQTFFHHFYYDFATVALPFPAFQSRELNPIRDILLTYAAKEQYMLSAILACGARVSHRRTSRHEDNEAYCSYLSMCLETLAKILAEKKIGKNIESMLLTILLLTSENAASKSQAWRTHLRGAKDLLLKYFTLKAKPSVVLIFCKAWFALLETLAGLSNPWGGTLKLAHEFGLLSPMDKRETAALQKLQLVRKDGFNLLFGCTNETAALLGDLIKIMHRPLRSEEQSEAGAQLKAGQRPETNPEVDSETNSEEPEQMYSEITRLIAGLHRQLEFLVIHKSGVVPKSHPMYRKIMSDHLDEINGPSSDPVPASRSTFPQNSTRDSLSQTPMGNNLGSNSLAGLPLILPPTLPDIQLSPAATGVARLSEPVAYSWFDIAQQAYVNTALLTVYHRLLGMPKRHPVVQGLAKRVLSLMVFLDDPVPTKSYAPMMVQWSMFFTGQCCAEDSDRKRAEKFFRLLSELGAGSAGFILAKLRQTWDRDDRKQGGMEEETSAVDKVKEIDILTY